MRTVVVIASFLLLVACTESNPIDPSIRFFDIDELIESKIQRNEPKDVEMTITTSDQEEIRTMPQYDLSKAYEYLKEFNINKAKWYDKYKVTNEQDIELYEALDPTMKIKRVEIIKQNDIIESIKIDYLNETIISDLSKRVIWNMDKSILIENQSKSIIGNKSILKIMWKW